MIRALRGLAVLAVVGSLAAAAGCAGTSPTRFYTLSPVASPGTQNPAGGPPSGIAVGLRRVELPAYLDRLQIVTRSGPNTIQVADFHHWAAPLDELFARALADNLSLLLPADRVVLFPWTQATPLDYVVTVEVTQFEGSLGGEAGLEARWSIDKPGGSDMLFLGKSRLREPATDGYAAMVSAQSRLVAGLAGEIAAAIKALMRGRLGAFAEPQGQTNFG